MDRVRVVCVSDTHLAHEKGRLSVPEGDLLIHAGDGTYRGTPREIVLFNRWLAGLPHRRKVLVAGNHDLLFQKDPKAARELLSPSITYLEDAEAAIDGLRIYGSPWQPEYMDWAFNLPRGPALAATWARIPKGVDILVTHGPPRDILDRTGDGRNEGCDDLLDAVYRVAPKLHVFGHIHEAYGTLTKHGTTFVNASLCDYGYRPANAPVVLDL
jgi:predicted phosphodiesterase